ncbi:GNAT family N-acetyltransferase [Nocardiopsis xinjiangensis]|uniref:GNAT family N-acetyltransferase n=1 Tax=Nocardiopsis xinjiangensis TaxID=124285 RepID=UPI001F4CE807|nr:GNAT family N-acetyltransferase [Nocardiopsis xinjiangensis]
MPAQIRPPCPQLRGLSVEPEVRALSSGYRLALWEEPWALGARCRERVQVLLRSLAARAFEVDHSDYWDARVAGGFFDRISTLALILGPDGRPVGWGGYHRHCFAGRRALYLDAAGVVPEHRRFGLSAALTLHFMVREVWRHPLVSTYVLLRTRHPAVYAGWRKGLGAGRVFPNEYRAVPAQVRRVAEEAAHWLGDGPNLEPEELLVRDAYRMFQGQVYGCEPVCGDERIDAYFTDRVAGKDALMVVARMNAPLLAGALASRCVRERARGWAGALRSGGCW